MSSISLQYNNNNRYNNVVVPGNRDNISALLQRAKFLQSTGATEQNNYELARIPQHLKQLQQNMRPFPIPAAPQQQIPRKSEGHAVFSQNQLNALKYQIMAFKFLDNNNPLPLYLQQAVLTPLDELSLDSPATPKIEQSKRPSPSLIPKNTAISRPTVFNAYINPYELIPKKITSYAHASRHQRILVPSLTPIGLDPQSIISKREERIKNRIHQSITKLNDENSGEIKDIVHLKSLKLLGKQQKLRSEMIKAVSSSTILATSVNKKSYRRMKKVTLKESRQVEAMERQQRNNVHQSLVEVQQQKLKDFISHGTQLISHHKHVENRLVKLGKAVISYHHQIEKEEQRKTERIAKERIQALKNDDEEAYMKLLDEAKDTRLTHLLKQTGEFLDSLTRSIVDQQHENKNMYRTVQQKDMTEEDTNTQDYFQITHHIKEQVCQPDILIGGKLKDYQIKGLQWMVSLYNNNLNGILADEMGLGKTIQTISLITYLIEKKQQNGPYLIVVPLSTLTNWILEFEKWAPSVKKLVYKGNPTERRDLANVVRNGDYQVLLTTFEYIIRDKPILSRVKWLYLIMDEGHRMKNSNSKLTYNLRTYYKTRYRLILTGTPLQNNLPELWALLNFILPKIFKSVKSFEEWFNTPFSNQGVQDKVGLNEEEQLLIIKRLHKVLRPFLLRRLKIDVESQLPDKKEHVVKCKLSALQLKLYQQLKKSNNLYINSSTNDTDATTSVSAKRLNNTIMQLRKVCNHPFVFDGIETTLNPSGKSNDLLYRSCGKFELLDRMLPKLYATGHRVLIFFQMTRIMDIMEDYLTWRGYTHLRLDGSIKSEKRSSLLKEFNQHNSPYFVFLLSTRAGGLGLNLQTADTVIIFDSDWNPHQDLQAQDRAHRIGQTKEVRIYRLVTSNSVEEAILARANYKLEIDGKVIQAGKFDNRSTEEDRETFLRTLLEDKIEEDEEEEEEDIVDDKELNEILQRSEYDLPIFREIDKERERSDKEMYRCLGYKERLIQYDELPEIFTQEEQILDPDEDAMLDFGRGRRARDDVNYEDDLTDEQWLGALEREAKENQRPIKLNKSRKRLNEDQMIEEALSKKRNKNNTQDMLSPELRQQLTHIFKACYKAVEDAVVKEGPDDDDEFGETYFRQRCELFMHLVNKKEYPDYYILIKQPISMNMIKKRIHSAYYCNVLEFEQDFHLIFDNARTFNEEGSVVYEDADEMQKIFDRKLENQCPGGSLPYRQKSSKKDNNYKRKPTPRKRSTVKKVLLEDEEEEFVDDDDDDDEYYE